MSADPITINGLSHTYGKGALRRQILFDVSTTIPAGEIVIVTGPSGSGKTTLLTIAGALRSAQQGSVRVLGEELCRAKARTRQRVRRQIGFIFQQHNLLGALSARQNVELGIRVGSNLRGRALLQRAEEMIETVGLAEHQHRKPDGLSGGQRQRVAIARALGAQPKILLADEPTASLDKQAGRDVVERMQALARQHGTTILLVTHDNRILDIADRILHLEDGHLSTFTDAVIAGNQRMMQMLAEHRHKQPPEAAMDAMDENQFQQALAELTDESRQFLEATRLAHDKAFAAMLERALRAFARRVAKLLDAERVSLMLVDYEREELVVKVSQDLPDNGELRLPLSRGIVGQVARSGQVIRVDDAYADPRFNRDIDKRSGFRTQTMLTLPLRDQAGGVFAVTQLLNRRDGQPFDDDDEKRFAEFAESLGVILDSLRSIAAVERRLHSRESAQ